MEDKYNQEYEDWLTEFVDKFNTIMINTATVNNSLLRLAEQLDTVYIMFGTLKTTTSRLLEENFDISKKEFDKMFKKVYKEIMSGKTDLQDEYIKSAKDLMDQHHELSEMIKMFRDNPKIAKA